MASKKKKEKEKKKKKYIFSLKIVRMALKEIKLDISDMKFNIKDIRKGMEVELEHGKILKLTNVTRDDPVLTMMIALAHLFEMPDYYEKLDILEKCKGTTKTLVCVNK